MAYTLQLIGSAGTVDFIHSTNDDFVLLDSGLIISPPSKKQVWAAGSPVQQGARLVSSTYENREITIRFKVTGTSRDDLVSHIALVEKLLEQARRYSIYRTGSRVELKFRLDGATNYAYFEIVDGDLDWPDNLMSVENVLQTEGSRVVIYDFELRLICYPLAFNTSPYSGSLTALTLSNNIASNQTTLPISNAYDADDDNRALISGSSILGDFPAVLKLQLDMQYDNSPVRMARVHIGLADTNSDLKFVWENTDLTQARGNGSPNPTHTSDSACSGGSYTNATMAATLEWLYRWRGLSNAQARAFNGAFRVFVKLRPGSYFPMGSYKVAFSYDTATSLFYQTKLVRPPNATTQLLDFGTVFFNENTMLPYLTEVYGIADSGTPTISVDYLMFFPIIEGYRILEYTTIGTGMLITIDDGWKDTTFEYTGASEDANAHIPSVIGILPRLKLKPGVNQTLYFLMDNVSGASDPNFQFDLKAWYVPQFNLVA